MSVFSRSASWWKILCIVLLIYTVIGGFLFEVPELHILEETIRNLYFHVPMWFGMIFMLFVSMVFSIKYLRGNDLKSDDQTVAFANTGILFGILGILTGMVWARFTWGSWWAGDPKQNSAAIGILIYLAYFRYRMAFEDFHQKARVGAVFNIFAFPVLIALLFIIPRLTDSLHPGDGGNPGFTTYDLDSRMRIVFYPAVAGFILLGTWISTLQFRYKQVKNKVLEIE